MQNKKPKLTLATISALAVLMVGYTLLVSVIIFSEEINLALTTEPILAEVEIASASEAQLIIEPQPSEEQISYIEQVLNNPTNIQPQVSKDLLPAEAMRQGKTTDFLMGF